MASSCLTQTTRSTTSEQGVGRPLPLPTPDHKCLQTRSWGGWHCRATSSSTYCVDECVGSPFRLSRAHTVGLAAFADALSVFCLSVEFINIPKRQAVDVRLSGARQLVDVQQVRLARTPSCACDTETSQTWCLCEMNGKMILGSREIHFIPTLKRCRQ